MLERITDDIFYTPCSEKTDRPNLGYIRGTEHCFMVDAGNSPSHVAYYMSSVREKGLPLPDYVFLTHHHWDHTFGLPYLDGVMSIAGERTNGILKDMCGWSWSEADLEKYVEDGKIPLFCRPHILLEYPLPEKIKVKAADISFDGSLRMDIGGETILMKHLTSGHTDECYCLLCERAGVLFIGDGDSEEVVGTEWIDHRDELTASIAELEAIDFTCCVDGHRPPKTKEELLDGLRRRLSVL